MITTEMTKRKSAVQINSTTTTMIHPSTTLLFVPDEDYSGYCKIEFKGVDSEGDSIEGTVVISYPTRTWLRTRSIWQA